MCEEPVRSLGQIFLSAKNETFHAFVQEKRQQGDERALDQIERHDRKRHERPDIRDPGVDLCAHCDDRLEGRTVELGKFRDQEPGVEQASEDGHNGGPERKCSDRALSRLVPAVDDGGGQHERAADGEICEVTDEGGRCALHEQLEDDLDQLAHNAGDRPEIERADQHGQLAQIHLVKRRREEQRDLQQHQNGGNGGEHCDEADAPGRGQTAALSAQTLGEHSQQHQSREDRETDEQKRQVFLCGGKQFFHDRDLPLHKKYA